MSVADILTWIFLRSQKRKVLCFAINAEPLTVEHENLFGFRYRIHLSDAVGNARHYAESICLRAYLSTTANMVAASN